MEDRPRFNLNETRFFCASKLNYRAVTTAMGGKAVVPRKPEVQAEIVKITPDMADSWLSYNTHNRVLYDRKVDEYRGAMERGEWKLNGDAIRFSNKGVLEDGQHRLWAIYLSGVPVESLVVRGLDPDAQMTMDAGLRRNLGSHLRLLGHKNVNVLAAVIVLKWKMGHGVIRTTLTPTVAQAIAVFEAYPDLEDSLTIAGRWRRRLRGSLAVVGVLHHEFASRDPEAAEAFFDGVIDGVALSKTSPLFALRRHLELSKVSVVMQMALMIKAWNAYVEGRRLSTLTWRPVGRTPEAFPEIAG